MKILFVCMGNICRSPMAEAVFVKLAQENNVEHLFEVDSAGLLNYHEGELADSRMRNHGGKRGYRLTHRSRPVTVSDFDKFDLIIGMDDSNISALERKAPTAVAKQKVVRMADYLTRKDIDHIPDPYYGGAAGFDLVIDLLEESCDNLLKVLSKERG